MGSYVVQRVLEKFTAETPEKKTINENASHNQRTHKESQSCCIKKIVRILPEAQIYNLLVTLVLKSLFHYEMNRVDHS